MPRSLPDIPTCVRAAVLAAAVAALAASAARGGGSRVGASAAARAVEESSAAKMAVEVLDVRPHDPGAYTQGLLLHEGYLYESTGRDRGEARLRKVDPFTGEVIREVFLPPAEGGGSYWGEGLALVDRRLVQLTWRSGVAFVYDVDTFAELGRHRYSGEGWGLCHDGRRLVMTDGSDELSFRDPQTFEVIGSVAVRDGERPVDRLNELECVGDDVYANVFLTDQIVRIDPSTGALEAWIDAAGLLTPAEEALADVLNGIAYDPAADTFLVTGKWWPKLFEVRFTDRTRQVPGPLFVPMAVSRG